MRNERDLYRDHLNMLIHNIMQRCTETTPDGYEVKTDKRSLELHSMAKGIEMARDAYDMCKQADKEGSNEDIFDPYVEDYSTDLRQ